MNSEKWQKVKEIFYAALDLPAEDRLAFVKKECRNEELLAEIEILLESHHEADDFIENPAFRSVNEFVQTKDEADLIGSKIGIYAIRRELGRGGMGAVYLAARDDGEFRQQVALKLIKRGMDTDEIIRRFRAERQILASLNHPFITRLIDGGATSEGLPYLVMDYVEGKPLTDYCEENNLSINERLELFLQVCAAVSYAHQNLIVHRDLKPSNILVTDDGSPRLLDFGIAKILADENQTTLPETAKTWLVMTPEYASPEQVRGERITTSTDVYSLGVVLYELLTGVRPFSFRNRSSDEINKIITDSEPFRPSSVVSRSSPASTQRTNDKGQMTNDYARLAKSLKGDLDNIVLMAMRKEPERRYSSVEQFASDIRRYLKGLPVLARQDSFSYRASKFVKRNKAGIIAGGGIALSLVAGIVATSRQARIARSQRDKAEHINDFLKKMLASADPRAAGKDVKVVEMLGIAAESLANEFADEPEIAADLRTTIGQTYLNLGLVEQAEPHLQAALETRRQLFGEKNKQFAINLCHLGQVLQTKGDLRAAERLYRQSLEILEQIGERKSLNYASVLNHFGYVLALQNEMESAIRAHIEELEIRRAHFGENHPETAEAMGRLANALRISGDQQAAAAMHRRALEILREFYAGQEHLDVARALDDLASDVYSQNYTEAENLSLESLRIRRRLLSAGHPDIAWALYNLAYFKINQKDATAARRYAAEVLEMRDKGLSSKHPVVSSSLLISGRSLMALGEFEQADAALRECLKLRRETLPADHWLIASARSFLGECLARRGHLIEGKRIMSESYLRIREAIGEEHEQTIGALERLNQFQ